MKGRDVGVPDAGYPDIVQFMSPVEPLVVWTGDFSFIPFKGRFIYLCVVRDHFTSEVLGQSMRLRHDSDLVVSAFRYAVERAGQAPSWFHSDQGSEYIGGDFDDELARHGVQRSTSPKRSPWRNGAQESFFRRIKVEFGDFERFDTLGKLVEATARYIAYYNDHRIHTTLGTTPVAFREQWYRKHADLHASVFPHTTEEKYI
jgi:putative transposase